jgi:hypothetical protein
VQFIGTYCVHIQNYNFSLFYENCIITVYTFLIMYIKKVKVALVQALRLCTGRTAHRVSRGIALPFHDHGTRRG